MSLQIERGALFFSRDGNLSFYPDGLLVVNNGNIQFVGSVSDAISSFEGVSVQDKDVLTVLGHEVVLQPSRVIVPPTISTHSHIFQPPGVPGALIEEREGERVGWLPSTLRFETMVKQDPEKAREIAHAKFESDIANGITGMLEYTTSSEEAVHIVMEVVQEVGLNGRVKLGYVCMDKGVDFIDGVELETSVDEALRSTERLLKDYPGQIVVIDRFPIACSSELRRALVELASEYSARYETHADESEGEAQIHKGEYGQRIIDTLFDDGVFQSRMNVGLAHAIHTNLRELGRIAQAIQDGCRVHIHACPNSNAQLGSHVTSGSIHVPFPLQQWLQIGATVSLGLDRGAGRGRNVFAEALWERGRVHRGADGAIWTPSYLELLKMATLSGSQCLELEDGLEKGALANYLIVELDGLGTFYDTMPEDAEVVAGLLIESGQDSRFIKKVVVSGEVLKG